MIVLSETESLVKLKF